MNPLKKLAGQTAIYGLSSIVGRLLNYLLVPWYTRIFTTAEYGVVTEMYAYVSFLIIILTYGMETGFFRFSESYHDKKTVYSTSLISLFSTSVTFIIAVIFFSETIAGWLDYSNHPEYIIWFGIVVGLDAFSSIPFANLRQQNKAIRFATIKLINIGVNIGLNLFFLLLCPKLSANGIPGWLSPIYDPTIGLGYVFISNLVASIVTVIALLPDMLIHLHLDTALLKKMLIYSFPLLIAGLAGMVNETFDRILLKYLLPDHATAMDQIGIYGANYKVSILMTLFIQTFRFAAEPFFFSQAKEKNSRELYSKVMTYFILFGLFIFLGVMLYIDVVQYFIGEEFRSGLVIVPILLFANLCLGIYYNLSIWYKLTNQTRYGAYISIFGAALTLIFNFLLIPIIGYLGSAWTTLICYFSMMVISFWLGQKYFPVPYNLKKIGLYSLVTFFLFLISTFLPVDNFTLKLIIRSFLLLVFIGFVIYNEHLLKYLSKRV